MIKGLNEYEKFKILRPLFSDCKQDQFGLPIIKKEAFNDTDWSSTTICDFQNIKSQRGKEQSIVTMFDYDSVLERIWNDPYRYLLRLSKFKAVCTPDYSISPNMNINLIKNNVYKNRWIGCFLQEKGIKVIPTIQWADESTYDFCFSGIEQGSVVIVSTIGCRHNQKIFLDGFNRMKETIRPELIIVFGKMIQGMTGEFLKYSYEDAFSNKNECTRQLQLFPINDVFTIKTEDK